MVLSPGFILQQFGRIHLWKKYINHAKLIGNFIYQQHVNKIFFREIYVQQCKRYPLLFSGPKDNNDFSHCSFMKNPPPPLVSCGYQIYVHSRSTNKGMKYKRCLFASFFFITINFIIIQTMLVKTTCN